jgi:hypothetical protein
MMPDWTLIEVSAAANILEYQMRIYLLGLLLTLGGCNDHKRPNSFDPKPSENNATPYNGVPRGEQKK